VKRPTFILSLLFAPSLLLASPTLTLPSTVLGLQTPSTGPSTYKMTLSGASGALVDSPAYNAWCTNPNAPIPSLAPSPYQTNGDVTYSVYNSYSFSTFPPQSAQDPTFGFSSDFPYTGGLTPPSYPLNRAEEWSAVNWVLNNLTVDTNINDVGAVIQTLLHPEAASAATPYPYLLLFAGNYTNALALYNQAVANDTFVPGNQNVVAVILDPGPNYQGVIIPVPVPSGGCTGTSSATLTKTASVASANAFQAITYTYVVTNTGSNTLTNIVVTDDNGTPNYAEDDFTVGTVATLAPGASVTFKITTYLPIKLFAEVNNNAIFDTLIPQTSQTASGIPATALLLTYLNDVDVTDNTYGTGASAGWAAVGGHTFNQIIGNYAEFAFYDAHGNLVSDFDADYLSNLGVSSTYPSGYGSAGLHGPMIYGSSKYVDYITWTLADNLNGYPMFYNDTVNSPVGDANWQAIAGYKVVVDQGVFGSAGIGSAAVKGNHLQASEFANSEPGWGWGCKPTHALCYTPQVICTKIVNTAYLCATVPACGTVIKAQATACVTLNGAPPPTCGQSYQHKCQHQEECRCTCANCQAGKHNQCTQQNCSDARCGDKGCPQQCQCHCIKCSTGDHAHCVNTNCGDAICRKNGCPQHAATAIVSYIQVGGASWQQTATTTVNYGSAVNLGPQPLNGSWSWTGPNGYTSTSRQINSIPLSKGSTSSFVATYTNSSGVKSTQTFIITAQ